MFTSQALTMNELRGTAWCPTCSFIAGRDSACAGRSFIGFVRVSGLVEGMG